MPLEVSRIPVTSKLVPSALASAGAREGWREDGLGTADAFPRLRELIPLVPDCAAASSNPMLDTAQAGWHACSAQDRIRLPMDIVSPAGGISGC